MSNTVKSSWTYRVVSLPIVIDRPYKSSAGVMDVPDCFGNVYQGVRRNVLREIWRSRGTALDKGESLGTVRKNPQWLGSQQATVRAKMSQKTMCRPSVTLRPAMNRIMHPLGLRHSPAF